MKKIFMSVTIMAVLLLSGCSSSDVRSSSETTSIASSEQTEEETSSADEIDEIQFGYDTASEDMDTYVYDGETLAVPFKLQVGKDTDHDVGFLVFIGGVVQHYSIEYADGSISEESTMQRFELSQKGEQKFTFLIHPNIGRKGDKLGIYICSVIYPSFQPESIEQPSYQYYGSLAQVVPQQVKFDADAQAEERKFQTAENGLDLTDDVLNSIEMFSSQSAQEALEDNLYVQMYQKNVDETVVKSENGKITLHLQLCGGVDGIYNTTIFINHEPVSIDGMEYIQSEITANKMSECEITLDVSDYEYLNTIYAVTVPADDAYLDYYPVEKTDSTLLVNDLKQED